MDDRARLPYTVLSCAMSIDGYIARAGGPRLVLSNQADLDRVDAMRAGCDAILVGAATIRHDNPRLLVRSAQRVAERRARGLPSSPSKVTVTGRAELDPDAAFFTTGDTAKLVYCASDRAGAAGELLGDVATVVDAGSPVRMRGISEGLLRRGVRRLLVEGGATVHTQFLAQDLADELQLTVAPFFVGDSRARRLVQDASFPWHAGRRGTLAQTVQIGDMVLLRYALSARFSRHRADRDPRPRS